MVAESFDDVSFRLALSRKDGDLLLEAVAEAARDLAATYSLGPHPRGQADSED